MSESPKRPLESVVRGVSLIGALLFIVLAMRVGTSSWHARIANSPMPNWKGGTMTYEDGFKITALLALFAAIWCYCAIRPKSIADRFKGD
jgi:hypothetical protein